jgi:hypothetical protein
MGLLPQDVYAVIKYSTSYYSSEVCYQTIYLKMHCNPYMDNESLIELQLWKLKRWPVTSSL